MNCIGIVKQREEAIAAVPGITINSLLPHKLAEFAPDLARYETMLRKAAGEVIGELFSKGQDPATAM